MGAFRRPTVAVAHDPGPSRFDLDRDGGVLGAAFRVRPQARPRDLIRMTEQEWIDAVAARAATPVVYPDKPVAVAREMLFDLYLLLSEAPQDALLRLSATPDQVIDGVAAPLVERMHRGQFHLQLADNVDVASAVMRLFSQVRALDAFLSQTRISHAVTSRPEKDWGVSAGGRDGFLIPRTVPRRTSKRVEARNDIGAFVHRALRHHRILPAQVNSYDVALRYVPMDLGRGEGDLHLGSGLFAHLDLDVSGHLTETHFRVGKVLCEKLDERVGEHVARAHVDTCSVMALPELTITPSQRNLIANALRKRPWMRKPDAVEWTVPLIFAGSWHEERDGKWYNVAAVLDGYGQPVVEHLKLFPYVDKKNRLEDIASGKKLTVIVTDDTIVATGVCRDFCERGTTKPNPYSLLDADLFVVISYGDQKTMEGHFATASDVQIRFRSEVLVVQQAEDSTGEVLGYVLSPASGAKVELATVKQSSTWKSTKPNPGDVDSTS